MRSRSKGSRFRSLRYLSGCIRGQSERICPSSYLNVPAACGGGPPHAARAPRHNKRWFAELRKKKHDVITMDCSCTMNNESDAFSFTSLEKLS